MRHCYVLRVFTHGEDGGNPLGVVPDVVGLSDGGMQEIAADLGFSETIFLDWQQGDMPRARIFTPGAELPFAGHPLVGAAWLLGTMGPGIDRVTCDVGEIPLAVGDDGAWIDAPPAAHPEEAAHASALAAAVGLPPPRQAWLVPAPNRYLVLELASEDEVAGARPDFAALEPHGAVYIVFRAGERVRARFFWPAIGVPEDPATGSAAVTLATICAAEGEERGSLVIDQGSEVGMPSVIHVSWEDESIRLGGTVRRDEIRLLEV